MEMFSTPRTASTSTTAEAASHVDGCPKSEQVTLGEPSNVGVHNVARVSSIDNEAGDRSNDHIGVGGVQFKKGPWTAMEDAILIEYVKARGEGNWNSVQRYSGLARCGKSCRLRWANHLRPNLKKGAFSPDEERLIVKWHAEFGNKWARMAALLPGRTDNEIKNYWNTRVKRHRRLGIPLYPSDIQPNPDIPPPKPHPSHRHHQFRRDLHSSPPTTSTAFAFQTQLPSSITPSTKPLFIINPKSISSRHYPLPSLCTPAPPFPSSFTFQTQPLPSHNPHIPTPPTTTPTDTSPATTTSTLPLFDFGLPTTTPPIPVQTSLRFRRDPSFSFTTPTIVNPHPFSLSLQQFSPASTATETTPPHISPIASPLPPSCFTDFFTTTATHTPDFQKEMEEENERICLLLADIAHHSHQQQPPPPELPSTQFLSPSSSHGNLLGMTTAVAAAATTTAATGDGNIKRVTRKRKILDEHHEGGEQDHQEVFFVEDLLAQEPGDQGCYRKQNRCMINHDDQEKYRVDGFPGTWNHSGSPISSSPGFAPNLETTGQQNMTTPEDLIRTCIQAEEINCETGDTSNDRSSVITDDNNIGLEMHHVASLFATTSDHDRATLDACSWDNLPEMC